MRRLAVCGAAALVVLTAAFTASAADCWLLDEAALAQAQTQGRCRDVFARNATPQAKPEAKPDRARAAKAARRAPRKAPPSPWAELERLMGGIKPDSTGQSRYGGIDHLAYGRAERTPVQR